MSILQAIDDCIVIEKHLRRAFSVMNCEIGTGI